MLGYVAADRAYIIYDSVCGSLNESAAAFADVLCVAEGYPFVVAVSVRISGHAAKGGELFAYHGKIDAFVSPRVVSPGPLCLEQCKHGPVGKFP